MDREFNPKFSIVTSNTELEETNSYFVNEDVVIKPDGLTAGKGVKVMGAHLKDKNEAFSYAKILLEETRKPVVIEEKLEGSEFTIMGITDGENMVFVSPTYDYPYRFDGDTGPGTGGMGCYTMENSLLPFLDYEDIEKCHNFMHKILKAITEKGSVFNGVLNGGFYKLKDGRMKLMEFNARIGDPECLNVMELIDNPLLGVIEACINKKISNDTCRLSKNATMVVYVVENDYAINNTSNRIKFSIDEDKIYLGGANVIYSSCERDPDSNELVSVGNSRLAAITMVGDSLISVRESIYKLIDSSVSGHVDWRKDIGNI